MSPKTYITILKLGIYLSFLSVFLVFKNLLFPYISSKQIYFNILIEILFVFWLAFIVKYPAYRPRKSWISIGLVGFFVALLVSSFTGVDFNLSFWGDVERMLGVFQLLHFFIFYLIIITAFREPKDWLLLFGVSAASGLTVSLHSLFETSYATIGNVAYIGAYLIFNIYFCLFLFCRFKNPLLKILLLVAAAIMAVDLWQIRVAGAYVGLGASFIILLFLLGVLSKGKKIKFITLSVVFSTVILAALFFLYKDSRFVENNGFLRVAADELSLGKNTFQTRLLSWKAAAKDFPKHPLFGTGYGNFSVTFDKYFEPIFYSYTASETYFDRAHNNLVDIASTAGTFGLFAYLSIFAAVFYYLIKGYRRREIEQKDFILLVSLIIAYFIQNLAVFDAMVSYLVLMITLGYVYFLSAPLPAPLWRGIKGVGETGDKKNFAEERINNNKEKAVFLIAGLLMFAIIYQYNIKPLKMLVATIDGQMAFAQGDIAGTVEKYKKALSYDTVLDRDSRATAIQLFTANSSLSKGVEQAKAEEIMNYVIALTGENVKYNPADSLMQMQLAQALNVASSLQTEKGDKFFGYSERALEAVDKSIAGSPGRVPIYFIKAQIYLTRGEKEKAIETLHYAISLNEKYPDGFCQLAKVHLFYKNENEAFRAMDSCLDLGGVNTLSPVALVKQLVNYYTEKNDLAKVIKLYERLTVLEGSDANIWANLANLYFRAGEKEKAHEAALKTAELNPAMKDAAEKFIRHLSE
ncbi:O-antigen ligase family protein [Candidatus Falkowbacteria bacterium]|nr:O-antigen ligase family protein [Candidatus Falkowbacteria bacterium]